MKQNSLIMLIAALMLSACGDQEAVSVKPDCQMAAKQVLDQEKNKPEGYFKRPVHIEELSVLQETEALLLCRGVATLSDNKQIPVHIQAKQHQQNWSYQLQRGSNIK